MIATWPVPAMRPAEACAAGALYEAGGEPQGAKTPEKKKKVPAPPKVKLLETEELKAKLPKGKPKQVRPSGALRTRSRVEIGRRTTRTREAR